MKYATIVDILSWCLVFVLMVSIAGFCWHCWPPADPESPEPNDAISVVAFGAIDPIEKENDMSSDEKHTPTPYGYDQEVYWEERGDDTAEVQTGNMLLLAGCPGYENEALTVAVVCGPNAVANVKFLKRACNAHDQLVAERDRLREQVKRYHINDDNVNADGPLEANLWYHCACGVTEDGNERQECLYHQEIRKERDRLKAAVVWIAEQEENICEDCNLREGIVSRCQAALAVTK